jgi:hypothetical protein
MFQLLSKILDVIDDPDWTQSFGNAFAKPTWPLCWRLQTFCFAMYRCGPYPHDSHDVMDVFINSLCFKEIVYMPRNFLASATLRNTVDIAKRPWVETCDFPPLVD